MGKRDNKPKKHQTKRKLTSNQEEWKHQVGNLKRRIRDLEGLGAVVHFIIPEMPKRVGKKAIEAVKNIGRKELEKFAKDKSGEEWVPPERGKAKERREEVKREKALNEGRIIDDEGNNEKDRYDNYDPYWYDDGDESFDEWYEGWKANKERIEEADAQIENLREYVKGLNSPEVEALVNRLLDNLINEKGKAAAAELINEKYENIATDCMLAVQYNGRLKGQYAAARLAALFTGRPLSHGELEELEKANDTNDYDTTPK